MIDEIFEMIIIEAWARPGKDLARKLNIVFLEVSNKATLAQDMLWKTKMRKITDENKRADT